MEEVSASVRDSKSTLPTQQAKFLKKQFSYRFFSLFEYRNWIEVYPNIWHFFFPVSTCYSCRVTYDANKRLKWFYKQRRKCFSLCLVVVSYKALLKPTFYYQVSIMKTNALYLPLKGKFSDYQLNTLLDSKQSRNDQSDVVFLCQNKYVLVDWESRTFPGTPSAKLLNTNNSKRDHLIHWCFEF